VRRRLPRVSARHRILCCEYSEGSMQEDRHRPQCVCRQRGARGSRDCRAAKLLSTQIVRKQAKASSSRTTLHIACNAVVNAFQQYEWLACLATAKLERRCAILELAHPPFRGIGPNSLRIHDGWLLKSRASRQEKASACNRNCATADEHFGDVAVFDRRADVDATGT